MSKILIVDDEESVRKPLRILLERQNHAIAEATNGDEALTYLDTNAVDLVITDVVMPVKGGLETLIETHRRWPTMPLIIMSGKIALDGDPIRLLTKQFGATRMLPKPFSKAQLLEAVSEALAT